MQSGLGGIKFHFLPTTRNCSQHNSERRRSQSTILLCTQPSSKKVQHGQHKRHNMNATAPAPQKRRLPQSATCAAPFDLRCVQTSPTQPGKQVLDLRATDRESMHNGTGAHSIADLQTTITKLHVQKSVHFGNASTAFRWSPTWV